MNATKLTKTPEETKQSQAVKDATTLEEHGFPVNTPDGQVMATKNVDPETGETVIEGENGTLEISEDPHILQPEGTADADAKKAASASDTQQKSSKSDS